MEDAPLIVGVVVLRSEARPKDAENELVARLARGGVRAAAVDGGDDDDGVAAVLREWGLHRGQVAVVVACGDDDSAGGDAAPENSSQQPVISWPLDASACFVMRQLVFRNAAAAAGRAKGRGGSDCATQQQQQQQHLIVGYAMRASREAALAAQSLLPLLPAPVPGSSRDRTLAFAPLDLSAPLGPQLARVDAVLHKASDELVAPSGNSSGGGSSGGGGSVGGETSSSSMRAPVWSPAIAALRGELARAPRVAVVDAFEATARVLDRTVLCALLDRCLGGADLPNGGPRCRAPRHAVVTASDLAAGPDGVMQRLEAAGLGGGAVIAKPLAACGVPGSHSMALALHAAALPPLLARWGATSSSGASAASAAAAAAPAPAPAPAFVVQEFANHGGVQHKAYVIGPRVFAATRPSIPDVRRPPPPDLVDAARAGDGRAVAALSLRFDSLASLPTSLPPHMAAAGRGDSSSSSSSGQQQIDNQQQHLNQATLEAVARALRSALGLTLFGFDVVVDAGTGDWLVVDVNYFPNYRGGPPEAAGWLREALAAAVDRCRQGVVGGE